MWDVIVIIPDHCLSIYISYEIPEYLNLINDN